MSCSLTQHLVLTLTDRIYILCRRGGYRFDATLHQARRQYPRRIFYNSIVVSRFYSWGGMRWRPTGAGASSHSSMMYGFQGSFTTFLGIFERDQMDRVLCTLDCRTCWAKGSRALQTMGHGLQTFDRQLRHRCPTRWGFVCSHILLNRGRWAAAKRCRCGCDVLINQKLSLLRSGLSGNAEPSCTVGLTASLKRLLAHIIDRIHFSHSCSYCVGHERHYAFMPHVFFFVLFSFFCLVTSMQSMFFILRFLAAF